MPSKKFMHIVLFAAMLAAVGLATAGSSQACDAAIKARLDSAIDRAIEEKRIVGTVVLVEV